MKTLMIILGASLLFCVMLPSCKEKSEDEEIEELVEKLSNAKTKEEATEIANKIEELQKKVKKSSKEVRVKLGQPVTFWELGPFGEKITRFSVVFERVSMESKKPWMDWIRETPGKKYVLVYARVQNLGPRKSEPSEEVEVKLDNGFIYKAAAWLFREIGTSVTTLSSPTWQELSELEPMEKGAWVFWSELIPEERHPIELFGKLGGYWGGTEFCLMLNNSGTHTGHSESIQEDAGTGKESAKIAPPPTKITESSIVGRYIAEQVEGEKSEKQPGVWLFENDGTVIANISGRWETEGNRINFYEGDKIINKGEIIGDTMSCPDGDFIKQEGAKVIKTLRVPVSSSSSQKEDTIWSNYSLSGDGSREIESGELQIRKDGTFSQVALLLSKWKIENGIVRIMDQERELAGRVSGNTIIFEEEGTKLRFVKQDEAASQKELSVQRQVHTSSKTLFPSSTDARDYTHQIHPKNAFDWNPNLRGYCTWYVADRWLWDGNPMLPSLRNARFWLEDANEQGIYVDRNRPIKGSIIVFGPTERNNAGHVAYVESVSEQYFTMSQMNAGSKFINGTLKTEYFGKVTIDRIDREQAHYKGMNVLGFIYPTEGSVHAETTDQVLKHEPEIALEFPETVPEVSPEPSHEGVKLIAEAEQDLTTQPKRLITARDKLNKALTMPLNKDQQILVKKRLSELANEWLFSREVLNRDTLCSEYIIKEEKSLTAIAKRYKVPYQILMEINGIVRPASIKPGTVIKVIKGPFHAIVYRSILTMDLYLQNTFVRSFPVGLGQTGNQMPTGLWRVHPGGKLIKPNYSYLFENERRTFQPSRYIGLEHIERGAKGNIHSAKDLGHVGTSSSIGCICLQDDDAILVYNLLEPGHSLVQVVDMMKSDAYAPMGYSQMTRQYPMSDLPMPRQYVEDYAGVINSADQQSLNTLLQDLEKKTGAQYIVLTVETTGELPIEQFSLKLARKWKLGQKGKDNGLLFVIAIKDKRYRFEVGYGLEHLIPLCGQVGKEVLVPFMKKGNYSQGIYQANLKVAQKIADEHSSTLSKLPN